MATYKDSGVDIDTADSVKSEFAKCLNNRDSRVLNKVGAFASLFKADFKGVDNPVLVLKSEEPGSKQLLAAQYNKLPDVAYDLVNHLINDIIVMGATPLAVLDTIICGKLDKDIVVELVKNMNHACRNQECSLIGGETSEQPGVIEDGRYILSASILGVVDENKIIDGTKIVEDDIIIGIHSNGLHTNGYSLVRKLIADNEYLANDIVFLTNILLPHMCYYQAVKGLFGEKYLHGMAHVTGSGIEGNIKRIIPDGLKTKIDWRRIQVLPIFKQIQDIKNIPIEDMRRTFNMGIGMALVVDKRMVEVVKWHIESKGYNCNVIGKIVCSL